MSLSLFTKLITISRSIKASGYNIEGQLDNNKQNIEYYITEPKVHNVYKMDRSTYHTIYITSDLRVWGVGYNGQGQLGLGSISHTYDIKEIPLPINRKSVKEVVCGGYSSYILDKNGDVYVTGNNDFGQLALNGTNSVNTFTKCLISNVDMVYAGGYEVFFKLKNGELWACGKNDYGQLGLGPSLVREIISNPIKVSLSDVKSVSCGGDFTLFIMKDNTIKCCGYNGYGQLGDGTYINRQSIIDFPIPASQRNSGIKMVMCGSHHSLVLFKDKTVWGCGGNIYGQLGLGKSVEDKYRLTKLNVEGINVIYTNAYTSIFQVDTQILYGCGENTMGELGFGDNLNRYEIERIPYIDIWMDGLSEDVIVIPEFDYNKKLFLVDALFITGLDDHFFILDNELTLKVYNTYTMNVIDTIYFYFYKGEFKYTKNINDVYLTDGSRRKKKYDFIGKIEACNYPFLTGKKKLCFSINKTLFEYDIVENKLETIYDSKYICTSINEPYAMVGFEMFDINNKRKVKDIMINAPKIDSQYYLMTRISDIFSDFTHVFLYDEYIVPNGCTKKIKGKQKLAFIQKNTNSLIFLENTNYFNNYESIELLNPTAILAKEDKLYIGTEAGLLWILYKIKSSNKIQMKMLRRFKQGAILSLNTYNDNVTLDKKLIINDNNRYINIGFSEGRYIKYPLYKQALIDLKVTGMFFIDDKIYYHVKIKINNFDYLYYNNIQFLLHNKYNEEVISLDKFDKNYEYGTTVVFERLEASVYTYLRLNYLYGSRSVGSIWVRLKTIKINMIYLNCRKLIINISNYSFYPCDIILEKYDDFYNISSELETQVLDNEVDHEFLYFEDIPDDIKYINIKAVFRQEEFDDQEEYILERISLHDIDMKYKVTEISYDNTILNEFDRLYNRLYENKNLDDVSFNQIVHMLNTLSHKKLDYVTNLADCLMDRDNTSTVYGEDIPLLAIRKNHYTTSLHPKDIRYRDNYRINIYINGLKVPYKDIVNRINMKDNAFTSYFLDRNAKMNSNNKNFLMASIYSESLILGEKEIYTIRIDRQEDIKDELLNSEYFFKVPGLDVNTIGNEYLKVYVKFRHGTFWNRINDMQYDIRIIKQETSYTTIGLRFYNEVILGMTDEIHICLNDLDKMNSYIFRDTAKDITKAYKNYFTPLVTINENGHIVNYYTTKSENIEIYVDGYLLTPYVDYKVINLPLHLQIPTLVLFKNPVQCDRKIEITILKENYIDSLVKHKNHQEYIFDNGYIKELLGINLGINNNFISLLENTFDLYLDGIKVPSQYHSDNRSYSIPNNKPLSNHDVEYIRFTLEDNDIVKFLITLLTLKLKKDNSLKETLKGNNGTISKDYFFNNMEKHSMNELYEDLDKPNDGLLLLLFELVDNALMNDTNPIIDCNDNQVRFGNDIFLDGSREFRIPYINSNIKLNANVDMSKDFYHNDYDLENDIKEYNSRRE